MLRHLAARAQPLYVSKVKLTANLQNHMSVCLHGYGA